MRVLICDDDATSRFALRQLLTRQAGCTVSECADGAAALAIIARERPDLILLDVEMQPVDGITVLTQLRQTHDMADVKVVMLSHERRNEIVGQLVKLGIEGYILKPARPDKVLDAVGLIRRQLLNPTGSVPR